MLIALTGPKRSGKDTVADFIAEAFAGEVQKLSFAKALKRSAAEAIGVNDKFLKDRGYDSPEEFFEENKEGVTLKLCNARNYDTLQITLREYLQYYGTEAHREVFGDNFWVDQVLPENYKPPSQTRLDIVTDCRFPNEAIRVIELGGDIFRIHRSSLRPDDTHVSEKPLAPQYVHEMIMNDGSLEDLKHESIKALNKFELRNDFNAR